MAFAKQIGIVCDDALQHLGDETVIAGEAPSDLGHEHLEALAADRAGGILIDLRHGRRDGEEVAHEERQRLGGDGHIALHVGDALGQPVQAPQHGVVEPPVALGIELAIERLLDQRRLGALRYLATRLSRSATSGVR